MMSCPSGEDRDCVADYFLGLGGVDVWARGSQGSDRFQNREDEFLGQDEPGR